MSDRHPTESASDFVTATLAIPSDAIRVIAAPPDTLTQRNVEAVTGLPPRVYLEVIRTPTFPLRVAKLGKLRIVNRAAFVAWLEKQNAEIVSIEPDDGDNVSNGIGEILDKVGLERSRGPRERRKGSGRRSR
jgi:hypothetical protein